MSIVVIPGASVSLLAAVGIRNVSDLDRAAYKPILQSFLAVMGKIDQDPEYTPPSLKPELPAEHRSFSKPPPAQNPMNAWSHLCEIKSPSASQGQSSPPRLLQGRTVAIKDNISVAGLPTTLGLSPELFEGGQYPISGVDAVVVARLLSGGAVTSLLPTAEIAIGSDQAGSVRIPACYCGIYGLKPTFGLVPYTGAASMSPMIDHLGPLAATLEDVAAVLETVAGYDGLDPRMSPESPMRDNVKPYAAILADFRARDATELGTWKIGLLREGFNMTGVSDAVRDTVLAAARSGFEAAGATVVDVSVPMHSDGAVLWNASTRPSMATWLLQGRASGHLTYLPPHIRPVTGHLPVSDDAEGSRCASVLNEHTPAAINILLSQQAANDKLTPGLEAKAHRRVLALRAAYDAVLGDVDVLITPCAPNVAPELPSATASVSEKLAYAIGTTNNTAPFNATGHPALNVPSDPAPSCQ
ncbi:MAG: hypothetical protein STHCBS139747_004839 [Sporothrix thermara]